MVKHGGFVAWSLLMLVQLQGVTIIRSQSKVWNKLILYDRKAATVLVWSPQNIEFKQKMARKQNGSLVHAQNITAELTTGIQNKSLLEESLGTP